MPNSPAVQIIGTLGISSGGKKSAGTTAQVDVSAGGTLGSPVVVGARRGLPYVNGAWQRTALATSVVPVVIIIPEAVKDFTIYAIGEAANTVKVSKSIDSSAEVVGGTATWISVDATLDSVGTSLVRYVLGNKLPMALKVESLVAGKWAKVMLLGKKTY